MSPRTRFPLLVAALLVAAAGRAQEPLPPAPPWLAPDPDSQALLVGMVSVSSPMHEGDRKRSLAAADAFVSAHPGHPLPLIMKARALREGLLEQDLDTTPIKEEAVPIHALLDEVVALCDAAKEAGTVTPSHGFYRGWAMMFKSQLHAIAVSNYAAGRAAAKGHGDLSKYLEHEPYDPDARGFMGIYEYYAATLPAVAKFFSKLLFIPGGNEVKGLANMRFACAKDGPMLTDHQVVRASTFVFFAGRLEDALVGFREILQRHPRYLRLAEPLAATTLFYPAELAALRDLQHEVLTRHVNHLEERSDWSTIRRLAFYESLAALLYESPAAAGEGFAQVVAKAVERPDWLDAHARLNLACLLAGSGQREQARTILAGLENADIDDTIRSAANACLRDAPSWESRDLEADFGFVAAIHDGRTAAAREGLDLYGLRRGENIVHSFYSGELALVTGDREQAVASFERALAVEAPLILGIYRMFAATRLAEIAGAQGDYETAVSLVEEALEARLVEPTLRLVLKGRKRYYERAQKGEIAAEPSLVKMAATAVGPSALHAH